MWKLKMTCRLALTVGEPGGIGPDLTVMLAQKPQEHQIVAICDPDLLKRRAQHMGVELVIKSFDAQNKTPAAAGEIWVYPVAMATPEVIGELNKLNGQYVLDTLTHAAQGCLDGVYDAWQTKAIIGSFDMLVSGRVHAAVAALSQCIPTVIIDYGHEPKAHKLEGFATVVQVQEYVANPMYKDDLNKKIISCWNNRVSYKNKLERVIPEVKNKAKMSFKVLKELF